MKLTLRQGGNINWLWLTALVILVDQATKQLILRNMQVFEVLPVLPHLNIVSMRNTGAAFTMFPKAPAAVFVTLSAAVSIAIMVWMWTHRHGQLLVAAALALIMGGALGNAIDRVAHGYVVDFVDFYVGTWHFASFNGADSAITLGAGLLILDMLLEQRRAKARSAA
jgi:signal peptidase II